jgi:hypothetical protein
MKHLAFALLALVTSLSAQEIKLSVFDRLKEKCSDMTDLHLNKNLIDLARGFLSGNKDGDAAKLKTVVDGLNGIVVKSCSFDKEGMYTDADVKQLISELSGSGWNLIISSTENHGKDVARIWVKAGGNGEIGGLRILSAEHKELSVIVIDGTVRPEDLHLLEGLGVPEISPHKDQTLPPGKKRTDQE